MISPVRVVVVVLPFDPVMATIGPGRNCAASSISPMTVSPKRRACTSGGASTGTPGLTTIRSWPRNVRSPCPPVSTVMPWSSRTGISLRSSSPLFVSETVTRAPCAFMKRADATPDLPRPTTRHAFAVQFHRIYFTTSHRDTEKNNNKSLIFSVTPCLRGGKLL